MPSQKLYAYVDESGQDTHGRIFIVTVVITNQKYQQLTTLCEVYEHASRKGRTKWHGTNPQARLEFMRLVIDDDQFREVLCYAKFQNRLRPDFDQFTVSTLAEVIRSKLSTEHYVVEAWVDGLSETKRNEYAVQLRSKGLQNIHLHRVRREESSTLVRLADSLAGLIRDAIEEQSIEAVRLVRRGQQNRNIIEIRV